MVCLCNCQIKSRQYFMLAYNIIRMAILYWITKFKSANIFAMVIWGSTAKFNSHQYFQLYGIHMHINVCCDVTIKKWGFYCLVLVVWEKFKHRKHLSKLRYLHMCNMQLNWVFVLKHQHVCCGYPILNAASVVECTATAAYSKLSITACILVYWPLNTTIVG